MDQVSLVANVRQVAEIARNLFCTLFFFYDAFKDAPKHSRQLREDLATICQSLDDLYDSITTKSQYYSSVSLPPSIMGLRVLFNRMNDRVTAKRKKSRRLKWPFTEEENQDFISKIAGCKITFSVHIQAVLLVRIFHSVM